MPGVFGGAEFADLVPKVDVDPEELDMTKSLIEIKTAQKFDMAAYCSRPTLQCRILRSVTTIRHNKKSRRFNAGFQFKRVIE
jgi:hypothetical protein